MYPKKFEDLINSLRLLPGVGQKSAERFAFEMLNFSEEELDQFIQSITNIKDKLNYCELCGNLSEGKVCDICSDDTRDRLIICVVESAKDVIAMEKTNSYHGLYHVLHGVISTSKGIMPDDINLNNLLKRVDDHIQEIIIATNPTIEGETTALYISKLLESKEVLVTRIAHGLPMGGNLDYAHELTIIKAMEGRSKI